eukprot:765553-Hanusia_phi.AAC.2
MLSRWQRTVALALALLPLVASSSTCSGSNFLVTLARIPHKLRCLPQTFTLQLRGGADGAVSDEVDDLVRRGKKAMASMKYSEAADLFSEALQKKVKRWEEHGRRKMTGLR